MGTGFPHKQSNIRNNTNSLVVSNKGSSPFPSLFFLLLSSFCFVRNFISYLSFATYCINTHNLIGFVKKLWFSDILPYVVCQQCLSFASYLTHGTDKMREFDIVWRRINVYLYFNTAAYDFSFSFFFGTFCEMSMTHRSDNESGVSSRGSWHILGKKGWISLPIHEALSRTEHFSDAMLSCYFSPRACDSRI